METYILKPSIQSLHIEMFFDGQKISNGTGFVVENNNQFYLLTNRHNVTGRDNFTDKCLSKTCAIPNNIVIWHNQKNMLGNWTRKVESLHDNDGNAIWIEHPTLQKKADFIALKLTQVDNVDLYPYDIMDNKNDELITDLKPTDMLSIVGFPFGVSSAGKLAIWSTGFIASELSFNYDNLPVFLIDSRTREGQSGSAVVFHRNPGSFSSKGGLIMSNTPITKLLGIYSGRIRENSDLGMVWKLESIKELIQSISRA